MLPFSSPNLSLKGVENQRETNKQIVKPDRYADFTNVCLAENLPFIIMRVSSYPYPVEMVSF